jgi:hypothetical protein
VGTRSDGTAITVGLGEVMVARRVFVSDVDADPARSTTGPEPSLLFTLSQPHLGSLLDPRHR